MSKKRSFFERLTGGMTLSDKDEKIEDEIEEIEMESKKTTKKSSVAKLTPLNKESSARLKRKESDEDEEVDEDEAPAEDDIANLSVDVFESHTDVVVNAFVAGVHPDNIHVTITRNSISIRGHRDDDNRKHFEQIENELFWGKFERDVVLTIDLEPDRAEASQKQGLLTITVPKIDKDRRSTPKVKSV
ncbi:MAG: Hsp20/alpha crystallin family protein [Candidatus Pacebacteria bacterium]|nr:Hsp20/alpha crystallin family protein [Candidatus Paceibacterota bacterium]